MITKEQKKMTLTTPSDTEIVLTRTFDAPRALVFEAMTKAEHIRRWWGCSKIAMTTCEADFRVGGKYRFVGSMDGQEFPFVGECLEFDPPARVVFTETFDVPPFNEHPSVVTTTFEEHDGLTTIRVTIRHASKEARDGHLGSGMETGAGESYDRLGELLEELQGRN